jgi:hypothetical protein
LTEALPHPTAITRPKLEVQHDFITIEQTRCPDPAWHFKIGVHKDSLLGPDGDVAPAPSAPQTLGLFHRESPPYDVEVVGIVAEREVDPADWLDVFLEADGKDVVSRKPVPMRAGVIGDAVATWTVDGEEFAGRFFVSKWGPRLFLLCFRTPRAHYAALAEDFFISIATFKAVDDSLGLFAEKVLTVSNPAPVPWRVVIPESWVVQPEQNSAAGSSFQATQIPPEAGPELTVLHGKLSFAVVNRSAAKSGRAAAAAYLDAVRELDVELERDDFAEEPPPPGFDKAWSLVTRVTRHGQPGELRCRVLLHRRAWVIAGVLGPVREEGVLSWMQNKRTLDIVTTTLQMKS